MYAALKRLVLGNPIATSEEHQTRLPKTVALPVFASDAISSTAYATQEILIVLIPAVGLAAINYLVPLGVVVCVLLAIVITSYRQTVKAYPNGGGTYIVSRENLGPQIALFAGPRYSRTTCSPSPCRSRPGSRRSHPRFRISRAIG